MARVGCIYAVASEPLWSGLHPATEARPRPCQRHDWASDGPTHALPVALVPRPHQSVVQRIAFLRVCLHEVTDEGSASLREVILGQPECTSDIPGQSSRGPLLAGDDAV